MENDKTTSPAREVQDTLEGHKSVFMCMEGLDLNQDAVVVFPNLEQQDSAIGSIKVTSQASNKQTHAHTAQRETQTDTDTEIETETETETDKET